MADSKPRQHDVIISMILSSCDLYVGPGIRGSDCSICYDKIEKDQFSVIHNACKTTWCSTCISRWLALLTEDGRPKCPICRGNMNTIDQDYDNEEFATERLRARLGRPAAQNFRVFKDEFTLRNEIPSLASSATDRMQLDADITSEAVEVEALSRRRLLAFNGTIKAPKDRHKLQRVDAVQIFVSEMLGSQTYRQFRVPQLPGTELCVAQKPPVIVAGSFMEVQSVLGDAIFDKILQRTVNQGLGRWIEWPTEYIDDLLIERPWSKQSAYWQYLQSRTRTTWMVLPCEHNETPFIPLDEELHWSQGLVFVFPSAPLTTISTAPTLLQHILTQGLAQDVRDRCKEIRHELQDLQLKRKYSKRELKPLEILFVFKELGNLVWDGLIEALFNEIPTTEEPVELEQELKKQETEVYNLVRRFHISWRLYFCNYWHEIMEVGHAPDFGSRRRQSMSSSIRETLRKLLVDDTVLGRQPVHKRIKKAAMNGVANVIIEEALKLAGHHVAFGWQPTYEPFLELDGDVDDA